MDMLLSKARESVLIDTLDEITSKAIEFNEIAASYDLRVLPWHNLASVEPMRGTNGEPLHSTVFGWTGEKKWWHNLTRRQAFPLADLCRYHTQPFWINAGSTVQSRHYSPYLEQAKFDSIWAKSSVRAILTVPLHMTHGQIGLVAFTSEDRTFEFAPLVDELAHHSTDFLTGYTRVRCKEKRAFHCAPLSAREIDCLAWAFQGKTDQEIAEIIDRSYATVRFYITSAATKLGTVNRAQTLAKAATLGYFSVYGL